MSTTVGAILEAERESAKAAIGLALRQASLDPSKRGRQEPGRQEPGRQEPGRQERPDATVPSNPSPPTNVHAVGRVSHPAKPIQSVKSAIVPEPDQIQSAPPVRPTLPHQT